MVLVSIFALVFSEFWAINTPAGGHLDEPWQMAHIRYLQDTGGIALGQPNLSYFQFPGFHLVNSSFSQICGLGIFETRTLFLLFSGVLFAALLYLLFAKFLKNPLLSSLGVLLVVQGGILTSGDMKAFWPGNLAFLFLIVLLLLLAWRGNRALGTAPYELIMIIFLAAFTISYLPMPICFIFILAAIYLLQKLARKRVVSLQTIALFLVMFLTWQIYWSSVSFVGMAEWATSFVTGFTDIGERLQHIFSGPATTALGGGMPLWASLVRFFWMALIFGLGTILGIRNLVKARRLGSMEVIETGGLLGVMVFTAFCFFTFQLESPNAGQFLRFFRYAPFFAVPIVLRFLYGSGSRNELSRGNTPLNDPGRGSIYDRFHRGLANFWGWSSGNVFTVLIILFFVLSLPTFLAHHNSVCTTAIYSYDCSLGEYLESAYGADEELDIFSSCTVNICTYYVPEAHFHVIVAPELRIGGDELWAEIDRLADDFESSNEENSIFVLSHRFRLPPGYPGAIEPTDPSWVELVDRLSQSNKIYDNGYIQVYEQLAE